MIPVDAFTLTRPQTVPAGAMIVKNASRSWKPRFVLDVKEEDWHPYSPAKYYIEVPELKLSRMPENSSDTVLCLQPVRLEVDPESMISPLVGRVRKGHAFHYRGKFGLIATNGAEEVLISIEGELLPFTQNDWPDVVGFEKWRMIVDGAEKSAPNFEYRSDMLLEGAST